MAKDKPPWYHEGMSADDATKILTKIRQPGAFLLRDSQTVTKEGTFTLSVSFSIDETGNFVDVQHYRIVKRRSKAGRKKFPSLKDIDECLQEQAAQSGTIAPCLVRAVEKSTIEEWEEVDANWRDKYKVHEGETRAKHKVKDPHKNSSKFSIFGRKNKKQPNNVTKETNLSVQLQADNSSQDDAMGKGPTESHSEDEDGYSEPRDPKNSETDGNNAGGKNENISTINTDSDKICTTVNQNIALPKQAEDKDDSITVNTDSIPKLTTSNDLGTETNGKDSDGNNDNQPKNVNTGIYMSSSAIRRNNETPGHSFKQESNNDQGHGSTVKQNIPLPKMAENDHSNGNYLTKSNTTNDLDTGESGNDSASQAKKVDTGIYMSPSVTSKNMEKSGHSVNQEISGGIYMSLSGMTTGNKMPSGGGSSANSGIYMSPNQHPNKNNEGSQEVGVDSSVPQNETQSHFQPFS